MKVGILAGGVGTRLAEETEVKPKPMIEIGGVPILWHIMKHYTHYGMSHFVIALGYKGEYIKKYMLDYASLNGNLLLNMDSGKVSRSPETNWKIELIETGTPTATGGRIKRLAPYLGDGTFMLTWGDGVSDIDLGDLLRFHKEHGKLATLTAVRPPARFGYLEADWSCGRVTSFSEKPQTREGWINGAFFVLEPGIFDYIDGDDTQWEREPLQRLAADGQLMAYKHTSFWQCMDTLRDKKLLEHLWQQGNPPWKIWI